MTIVELRVGWGEVAPVCFAHRDPRLVFPQRSGWHGLASQERFAGLRADLVTVRAIARGKRYLGALHGSSGAEASHNAKVAMSTAPDGLEYHPASRHGLKAIALLAIIHDRLAERDAGLIHLDTSAALTRQALSRNIADGILKARLLNSLATSLVRRGERAGEKAALLEAVTVFHTAVQNVPPTRRPALLGHGARGPRHGAGASRQARDRRGVCAGSRCCASRSAWSVSL